MVHVKEINYVDRLEIEHSRRGRTKRINWSASVQLADSKGEKHNIITQEIIVTGNGHV